MVGHPNKGKSSIVATMVQNDAIRIAPDSGTTTRATPYPMTIDGEVLYTLIDTPGFQRPRQALAWMRSHETTAADHSRVVRQFVEEHRSGDRFADECALLEPILDGAGILYVVDGSVPFGAEYEPEMEILRWTGRPRMALINSIGDDRHVDVWIEALGQYFSIVRRFNAVTAEFEKRVELLGAFRHLETEWGPSLDRAAAHLRGVRAASRSRSVKAIAEMMGRMLTFSVSVRIGRDERPADHRTALEDRYRDELRAIEKRCRRDVERAYDHRRLERRERDLDLVEEDLFSERTWNRLGLSTSELITMGLVSGGLIGTAVNPLQGTVLGAAVGGAAAWWSAGQFARVRIGRLTMGGRELVCGPSTNPSFPFVVLNRACLHHDRVAGRTHANQDALDLEDVAPPEIDATERRDLMKLFTKIRRTGDDEDLLHLRIEVLEKRIAEIVAN